MNQASNKRKWLTSLMTAMMSLALVLALAACGGGNDMNNAGTTTPDNGTTAPANDGMTTPTDPGMDAPADGGMTPAP
ncbi:hypothetical protein IDH44_14515 [Paenibacillus sp. IB182496]|uniref:Uncharacterized protein n=1 Tax=Paenibacillus sabuli TaxID=2772509 RepID=A0A927BV13_9BACL|nr:hypothetical protein [Paenibacillus sabuli]MBD2846411.1 hypothetical protein [Paenibacillus sabuli]